MLWYSFLNNTILDAFSIFIRNNEDTKCSSHSSGIIRLLNALVFIRNNKILNALVYPSGIIEHISMLQLFIRNNRAYQYALVFIRNNKIFSMLWSSSGIIEHTKCSGLLFLMKTKIHLVCSIIPDEDQSILVCSIILDEDLDTFSMLYYS